MKDRKIFYLSILLPKTNWPTACPIQWYNQSFRSNTNYVCLLACWLKLCQFTPSHSSILYLSLSLSVSLFVRFTPKICPLFKFDRFLVSFCLLRLKRITIKPKIQSLSLFLPLLLLLFALPSTFKTHLYHFRNIKYHTFASCDAPDVIRAQPGDHRLQQLMLASARSVQLRPSEEKFTATLLFKLLWLAKTMIYWGASFLRTSLFDSRFMTNAHFIYKIMMLKLRS